ncbi:hypothetical protein EVAR_87022_1 [Eumeta japonica]|uniref:Uncharacterized protein n=1 Tax=Eumeta variegata TaxID=151549 RepID=A0A4C1Z5K3_EUMVA|nr:hypothetical protein EVAR_87022_1 [Eumeta japonica]
MHEFDVLLYVRVLTARGLRRLSQHRQRHPRNMRLRTPPEGYHRRLLDSRAVADFLSRNSLEESNVVKTVEEEIELEVYRVSAETLIERQRDDEFFRCTVEASDRNGGGY